MDDGLLKGLIACQRGTKISHIFFANDSLIFCRAIKEECSNLQRILETYKQTSGQKLNGEKTYLFFNSNTPQDIQDHIKDFFGAEVIRQHETNLCLPSLVGKSKCNTFRKLKERFDNILSGWKEKMLLHVRKEIFFKEVTQVISMYMMGVFKIPNTLYDEMTSMVRNFWWGQMDGKTKMAWLSWDKVCTPK